MHFVWFRSTSLRVFKFVEMKEGGSNFWGEPILQNVWIILSPLLYFNLKSSIDPNSSSFIAFQCILHDSGVRFSESWNFQKSKSEDLISGENQFSRMSQLFGPPSIFQFQKFSRPKFFSFIAFQCILHDSGVLFSESSNFQKSKMGNLISGAN